MAGYMDELSERQKQILRIIIEEYINTVRPVASENIAARHDLGVKPATVRNEMAELEAGGYITHLHTSAGRIPSDKGYRYFVQQMLGFSPGLSLPNDEQRTIQHQFHQVQNDVEEWMRLSAAVLARTAQNTALVTEPRSVSAIVKHCQLLSIKERTALIVLLTQDGTVRQQIITLGEAQTQDELTMISNKLNERLVGRGLTTLPADEPGRSNAEREIETHLVAMLHSIEDLTTRDIIYDGLVNMLSQPEFKATERVKQVLEIIEGGGSLLTLLTDVLTQDGVQVIIGDENRLNDLRQCSVILARYGVGEKAGVLGIIGPTRMEYGRSIGGVRYVARLLSEMMEDVYGPLQ